MIITFKQEPPVIISICLPLDFDYFNYYTINIVEYIDNIRENHSVYHGNLVKIENESFCRKGCRSITNDGILEA